MTANLSKNIYFIDSNIWIYGFAKPKSEEETQKHKIAQGIINLQPIILSTQVVNEVCVNLIKKSQLNEQQISNLVISFYHKYTVIQFKRNILLEASRLRNFYQFSFWDSLIIASALHGNADILYSEDMQDGLQVLDCLTIVNPFNSLQVNKI